ncbi:MAG: carbohydrate kinase family protein [Chloroflexota bacterium]|nr:carbohydrate kinase family protein [Anaerolineae bacterium]
MGNPYTVISVGDLVADLIVEIPELPARANEHQIAHSLRLEPGGAGSFLIAGARLGMRMQAMGCLGDDLYGRQVIGILRDEGVDVRAVAQPPGSTSTTVLVLTDDTGEHVFLGVAGHGTTVSLTADCRQEIRRSDALFTYGYALLEEQLAQFTREAVQEAHQQGVPVFFDPGPLVAQMPEDVWRDSVRRSRVLLLTEDEACRMGDGLCGEDVVHFLLKMGPELVVLKRGERGCLVATADQIIETPGFPVPVRDTAAAGDSFDAAFVYGYLHHYSLSQTAVLANAMGAAKVQKMGSGTKVPTAGELIAVLRQFGTEVDFPAKGD